MDEPNRHRDVCDHVLVSLRRIIQSIDQHSRFLMKRFHLTGPQLMLLQEIERSDEVSASQLATAISLSQATVTGILERLEKRGLVLRQRSDTDRRRVMVTVTAAGVELLAAAPPLMQSSFTKRFMGLQEWEQHMILSSLQRIVVMMNAKMIDASPILTTGPIEPPATELLELNGPRKAV